jgi:hypothetical protein
MNIHPPGFWGAGVGLTTQHSEMICREIRRGRHRAIEPVRMMMMMVVVVVVVMVVMILQRCFILLFIIRFYRVILEVKGGKLIRDL